MATKKTVKYDVNTDYKALADEARAAGNEYAAKVYDEKRAAKLSGNGTAVSDSKVIRENEDRERYSSSAAGKADVANKAKQTENQNWINSNYEGGLNAYKTYQQQRYDSAIASGDNDLLQKLEADANRVGYVLMPSKGTSSGGNGVNSVTYNPYASAAQGSNQASGIPSLDLPTYKPFEYDDFNYNAENDDIYKQYAAMYARQGQSASEAALANAAAATGGMASSYAAAANSQAQQAYAKKTADMIPVLEQNAYSRYSNERELSYQDYLNAYNASVNNAQAEYNAGWDKVNYTDSRNDLAYDRQKAQEAFDYEKFLNEQNRTDTLNQNSIDNAYRQSAFDYSKQTDQRDFNYNKSQDSIRNSLSADDNARAWATYNYNKEQDALARQDKKEAEAKEYNQYLRDKIASNKQAEYDKSVQFKISDFVSQALQSGNAQNYLMKNQYGLTVDEYSKVIDMLKGYNALSTED